MIKKTFKKSQLYINYLGPSSSILGNLIATPILISNLGLEEWSLFALISILLPLVYLILFGSGEFVKRLMINVYLDNEKTKKSINMFYKYENINIIKFTITIIFLSIALIFFNSNNYPSFETIEISLVLVSIAVLIKIFEFYYSELLSGLKQHYKLHLYAFIITISKWGTVIYLSFIIDININSILLTVIFFSCLMLINQRIIILNVFKKKQNNLINQNKEKYLEFNENNFGIIIFLILLLQQFYNVLAFGILNPISLSYFGISFMISAAIPLIISPIIVYLTPEIYETVEINSRSRKKFFAQLIIAQFIIIFIPLVLVNIYLEKILLLWLGKTFNYFEISSYLVPLSISTLSISLFNTIKIFYIAENKISFMKKPLFFVFFLLIFLTINIYLQILSVEAYLYCWSISLFFLMIYFCFLFFQEKYKYH